MQRTQRFETGLFYYKQIKQTTVLADSHLLLELKKKQTDTFCFCCAKDPGIFASVLQIQCFSLIISDKYNGVWFMLYNASAWGVFQFKKWKRYKNYLFFFIKISNRQEIFFSFFHLTISFVTVWLRVKVRLRLEH